MSRPEAALREVLATTARRPVAALLVALVLTGLSAWGLTRIRADARVELLADTGSQSFAQQQEFANAFGADPIVVVIAAAPGRELLTPDHMVAFASLEGSLHRQAGVQKVYGVGTLVNELAKDVTDRAIDVCGRAGQQAEQAAIQKAAAQGKTSQQQQQIGQQAFDQEVRTCVAQLSKQFPSIGLPAVNNPAFYGELLLEPGGKQVRPFWKWALPDRIHAMITVRLKPDASQSQVEQILKVVRGAAGAAPLKDTTVAASGTPVLAASLAQSVIDSLFVLLPVTLIAMLLVTLVVLRGAPMRLLALPLAVLAVGWCAGLAGLLGLRITPATLAVLPVVLGLATDYALQAANRLSEASAPTPAERVAAMARSILPTTGLAAVATAAGLLAFALSPIPLVRQFAFFLALGVAAAWLVAVLVGVPLMVLLAPRIRRSRAPAWPLLARGRATPLALIVPLAVLGLAGWAALPSLNIETDIQHLMPAGDPALREAQTVIKEVGVAGELDLVVRGADTSSQQVLAWQAQVVGLVDQRLPGRLKEIDSLPTFLESFNPDQHRLPDAATTQAILRNIPSYFSGAVITQNRSLSRIVFGQGQVLSVQQDAALLRELDRLPAPPAGYTVYEAGLAVVASGALAQLQRDQVVLNVLAIVFVLAVLLAAYRRPLIALLAVLPTVVAAGWATGLLWLTRVQANPVTVLLAGVVVAFATEFSVLWLARYREELAAGAEPAAAADIASRRVGPAVVASAAALVLGFLLLGLSPVPMVREFGLWSGADLGFATAAVLVLLPPLATRLITRPAPEPAAAALEVDASS